MSAREMLVRGVPIALVAALTACGSQLDPSTVAQVNGGSGSVAQAGSVLGSNTGSGSLPDGSLPDAAGADPGSGPGSGSAPGDNTGSTSGDAPVKEENSSSGDGKAGACDGFDDGQPGSASVYDSGGAATADGCGLPDLRMLSLSRERANCDSCYAVQVTSPDAVPNAGIDYFKKAGPEAIKSTAILYVNVGDLKPNAEARAKALESRGYDVKYLAGVDPSEFNYAPYVQQLKDKGIRFLQFGGSNAFAVRMAQAMQQQSYKPDFFVVLPTQYNQAYLDQGGDAVEGSYVQLAHSPFGSPPPRCSSTNSGWSR